MQKNISSIGDYLIHSAESFLAEKCKANALKPDGRNTFYDKVRNFDVSITDGRAPDRSGNSVQEFHGIAIVSSTNNTVEDDS